MSNMNERLDGFKIFRLHLGDVILNTQEREPRQRLHVRVPFELEPENARNSNSRTKPCQTQVDHVLLVRVL